MRKILVNWLLSALALYVISYLFKGVSFSSFGSALAAAFVLGFINSIIKPIVTILSLPLTFMTLGLFSLVVNGAMLLLTSAFVPGFRINGLWTAILAAIVLSFINCVFISDKDRHRR